MADNFVISQGDLVSVAVGDPVVVGVVAIGGPTGAAGAAGAVGATGPAGASGAAATITVGTVSTGSPGSSATVTNVGTSSSAIFNFTIPQGATGAAGSGGGSGAWSSLTGVPSALTAGPNVANGFAGLDGAGLVPAAVLPSYVDDVLEYASVAGFPATGTSGKIYVALDLNKTFRWSGSAYVEISASPGSTDSVTEGATNLYFTTSRASSAAPVQSVAGRTGAVSLVKADVGLGSVDNTADSAKSVLSASKLAAPVTINGVSFDGSAAITVADSTKEATANKNAVNGYAGLDASGLVPANLLPSYVDDVLEFANLAGFPGSGVTGKIYVALDTNKVYRWSGSAYIEISPSPGSTDGVSEGSTNLYYTNARASAAAPVQSVAGRTGAVTLTSTDVGLGSVDNTSNATERAAVATLTNKRVTPRVGTVASSATPAIDTDTTDLFTITALAANITSMTSGLTGTPTDGQKLMIRIKGAAAQTITWGASFISSGVATLLASTVAGKTHTVGLVWDAALQDWVCVAVDATGY